ncbi:MAG: hypothetical protein KBT04_02445 [Bacteroidales bacterium]|nr:hypothetical protein [Candidatus Colimorpha onthohippi]
MNNPLHTNSTISGVAAALIVSLLPAVILACVLLILHEPVLDHYNWFAGCALPPLLLIRYYAKAKDYPQALKGAIITLFVLFILYMMFYTKQPNVSI